VIGIQLLILVSLAVQQKSNLDTWLPADADSLSSIRGNRAGGERGELQIVPPVERELRDLSVVDHRADRRVFGMQQGSFGLYGHGVGDNSDFEEDVDLPHVADVENDALLRKAPESGRFDADGVFAQSQWRRAVFALFVRLQGSDGVRRYMSQRDGRFGNDSSRRVQNGSDDNCRVRLLAVAADG